MRARKKPEEEKSHSVTKVNCVSHCTVTTEVFLNEINVEFRDSKWNLFNPSDIIQTDERYFPRLIFSVQAATKDEAEAAVCKAKQKLIERLLA